MRPRTTTIVDSLAPMVGADGAKDTTVGAGRMEAGKTYYSSCDYADDGSFDRISSFTYQPGDPVAALTDGPGPAAAPAPPSAVLIAHQAYAELDLPLPEPRTSPPPDSPVLVGLAVILWLDPGAWEPVETTASAGGVTVTVTAEPASVRWDMGDGTTFTCTGPGTPWTGDGPDRQPPAETSCRHVYQHVSADQPDGTYPVTATVTWSVTWSASTGESGSLPDTGRSATVDLEVRERQAVID